jgi:hypothetical protein
VSENPHIAALRSAEQELRDHDKRIADAANELKLLKLERRDIAARVNQCIDVLCGRAAPSLFDTTDHAPAQSTPVAVSVEPAGVQYPTTDDWRKQGLALMGLSEKLVKACKRQEVFAVGELHDWIDEESRDEGGVFGRGVLKDSLRSIGKITLAQAAQDSEKLFQFFADYGFRAVPE